MSIRFDVGGLEALARDFDVAASKYVKASRDLVKETAEDIENDWRKNAESTAGQHGKHYPKSIRAEATGFMGLEYEIAPAEGMRQAAMSFEYGSVNQPPHLDGQRALDDNAPRFMRRVDALEFL